jgi:tRNA A37 methylthiotransferase MiaB
MRRFYSGESFKKIVDAFRACLPDTTLATDVICGFPGESKEAFKKTLQLIESVKPDIVNVSKFFARPGTAAAEMHDNFVSSQEIRRRSSTVAKLASKVASERNMHWVGWTGSVLVDEVGKVSDSWVGRNFTYKPTAVKSSENLLGKTLSVKVVKAFSTYLQAEIVE